MPPGMRENIPGGIALVSALSNEQLAAVHHIHASLQSLQTLVLAYLRANKASIQCVYVHLALVCLR